MARAGKTVATFVSGGAVGALIEKLSGADVRALLSQALTGFGNFVKTQGQYASFAILCAIAFGGVAIWAINRLITGKDAEIARIAAERDRFQQLVIDDWRSSAPEKGARKMTPQQTGLLVLQLLISLAVLGYIGILMLEARKEKLKFRFFAVRDQFLYQVATGVLGQDTQVFRVFYHAMNLYISQMERFTLTSFIRASVAVKTELEKENQQRLMDALSRTDPAVQKTVTNFIGIVIAAMKFNNPVLSFVITVAVHCSRFYAWFSKLMVAVKISRAADVYAVYETYQFYDDLQGKLVPDKHFVTA